MLKKLALACVALVGLAGTALAFKIPFIILMGERFDAVITDATAVRTHDEYRFYRPDHHHKQITVTIPPQYCTDKLRQEHACLHYVHIRTEEDTYDLYRDRVYNPGRSVTFAQSSLFPEHYVLVEQTRVTISKFGAPLVILSFAIWGFALAIPLLYRDARYKRLRKQPVPPIQKFVVRMALAGFIVFFAGSVLTGFTSNHILIVTFIVLAISGATAWAFRKGEQRRS